MRKKLFLTALVVLCFAVSFVAVNLYAEHGMKKGKGFGDKFDFKIKMIMSNEEELGLSESQMKKAKSLRLETKKSLIKTDAQIDLLALDIKEEMYKDPMDVNAINKLVDKKYDLKKEKAKTTISACASLKEILTDKQKDAMKKICKQKKKDMMSSKSKCPMMSKMHKNM